MTKALKRTAIVALLGVLLSACGDGNGGSSGSPTPGVGEGEFDLSLGVQLMQLCLESYQMLIDYEAGQTFTLPAPYTLQLQILTTEEYTGEGISGSMVPIAFIATSGSSIYVVFRGTVTISEWISDADLSQVPYTYVANGGMSETGFTGVYDSIRTQIIDEVKSLASSGTYTKLYITGHSLGGAVSVLAAPDLSQQTSFSAPIVYTFAGPRAGDPIFALLYNNLIATSWRVVNTNDEVPTLPPVVTVVFDSNHEPRTYFYEHVNDEFDITFGVPIHNLDDLEEDHSSCNYYATLCDKTSNPTQCKQMGNGLNSCSF